MTDASRRRLMGKFASVDWDQVHESGRELLFLTLTVPPELNHPEHVYRAGKRFFAWLRYRHGAAAIVRRELTRSGLIHYHLMLVGPSWIDADELRCVWTRCLRSERLIRVHVERIEKKNDVTKYLSKYCVKAAYEGADRGEGVPSGETSPAVSLSEVHNGRKESSGHNGHRWWYVWGKERIPWGEEIELTAEQAIAVAKRIKRVFRKWLRRKTQDRLRRELLRQVGGNDAERFARNLAKKRTRWAFGAYGTMILWTPAILEMLVDWAAMEHIECPF